MVEGFHAYIPEDVILGNLSETRAKTDAIREQEISHLNELAGELIKAYSDPNELLESLPDNYPVPPKKSVFGEPTEQNARLLPAFSAFSRAEIGLLFCRELFHRLGKAVLRYEMILGELPVSAPISGGRVIYQRNGFTDEAFLRFSTLIGEARASYSHSFASACEEVYNGQGEYCILPISNSSEGQLNSFYRLIIQFDLKIVSTCEIKASDGSRITRFALLRRNLFPLLPGYCEGSSLEINHPTDAGIGVPELLFAANLCGLTLTEIGEVPALPLSNEQNSFRICFQASNAELHTFLLFLRMTAPRFSVIGLYKRIPVAFTTAQKGQFIEWNI